MTDAEKPVLGPSEAEAGYAAFLLRVWHSAGQDEWRILIEEVGTEKRQGCIDWNEVLAFIQRVFAARVA